MTMNKLEYCTFVLFLVSSATVIAQQNDLLTDFDGNQYRTVTLGRQTWMAENLKSTHYSDGTPIPKVLGHYAWNRFRTIDWAFCWYDQDSVIASIYGNLYTWCGAMKGAVATASNPSGIQGVCPSGWHLPSDTEWTELEVYLQNQGYNYDGTVDTDQDRATNNRIAKALSADTSWHSWTDPGAPGSPDHTEYCNKTGFNALAGGYRYANANFFGLGFYAYWWTATESDASDAIYRMLNYYFDDLKSHDYWKDSGLSVRCVKDYQRSWCISLK